jgi:hypothetical protein
MAPATSPVLHFDDTWVAKMIAAIPVGMQHSKVAAMAQGR